KKRIPFNIRLKRDMDYTELLTTRQEQILMTAFQRGFFDFPKKAHLKELAEETGTEESTLTEILRRAQRKIIAEYLDERNFQHPR
ncbi:MAG TPA: helix-turn-helix domain-containing protein, partial [Nitrososphaerales archaeon]|nr:helix-turn-helix domain-containing protein [Nitrososphaerales archaeon]